MTSNTETAMLSWMHSGNIIHHHNGEDDEDLDQDGDNVDDGKDEGPAH